PVRTRNRRCRHPLGARRRRADRVLPLRAARRRLDDRALQHRPLALAGRVGRRLRPHGHPRGREPHRGAARTRGAAAWQGRGDHPRSMRFAIRLAWLAVLVALIGDQLARRDTGARIGGGIALAVATLGWLGWARVHNGRRPDLTAAALLALGAGGAVLAPWAGLGLVFLAVAGIASAESFDLPQAVALTACGPIVLGAVVLAEGSHREAALG